MAAARNSAERCHYALARCAIIWTRRYEDYAPLAAGARELERHVSEMRPCHNLNSLADLAQVLGKRDGGRIAAKS